MAVEERDGEDVLSTPRTQRDSYPIQVASLLDSTSRDTWLRHCIAEAI
jgi:hypothetical protein